MSQLMDIAVGMFSAEDKDRRRVEAQELYEETFIPALALYNETIKVPREIRDATIRAINSEA